MPILTASDVVSYDMAAGTNQYVTVETTDTITGNQVSSFTVNSLSADGRFEVFSSRSSNLVSGDSSTGEDVFLRDHELGTTTLISRNADGNSAGGTSAGAMISANGRFVVFRSASTLLDVSGPNPSNNGTQSIYRWQRDGDNAGQILLISVNADGDGKANNTSSFSQISEDGNLVVFSSFATNLGPVSNGTRQIYVRNVSEGTTKLVSRSLNDANISGNANADGPRISRDGSTVIFYSSATNLDAADTNSTDDLYAYDVESETVELISVSSDGTSGGERSTNSNYRLSDNGNIVVFQSDASNLHPLDDDTSEDIFVRDRSGGTTELISVNFDGDDSGSQASTIPDISLDGRYVTFQSNSNDLVDPSFVSGLSTANTQVYVRDRSDQTTTLISVSSDGTTAGNDDSTAARISGDGQTIVFQSEATNVDDSVTSVTSNVFQTYRRDWLASVPTTTLVSRVDSGTDVIPGNNASSSPRISDESERISFSSTATDLGGTVADGNGLEMDLFSVDLASGSDDVIPTSVKDSSPRTLNSSTSQFDVSNDGLTIAFVTTGRGVVAVDNQTDASQVYVRQISDTGSVTRLVSVDMDGGEGETTADQPSIDGDGEVVVFQSNARDLSVIDTFGRSNIFVRDLTSESTTLLTVGISNGDAVAANGRSLLPNISNDGNQVAFYSSATNFDLDETLTLNGQSQLFVSDWNSAAPSLQLLSRSDETGDQSNAGVVASRRPGINDDGDVIIFDSSSTNLDDAVADTNRVTDVFAFAGEIQTVSASDGTTVTSPSGASLFVVDEDASVIVFTSADSGFTSTGNPTFNQQLVARDLDTQVNEFVSIANDGTPGNGSSFEPSIDGSGNFIAFASNARSLPGGSGNNNVYVHQREEGITTQISVADDGSAAVQSFDPEISFDASVVVFESTATNILPDGVTDILGQTDIFIRDWQSETPTTRLVNLSVDGTSTGDGQSFDPKLSDDGSLVVFASQAGDLIDNAVQLSNQNLFFATVDPDDGVVSDVASVATLTGGGFTIGFLFSSTFGFSDDGRYVAFTSTGRGAGQLDQRSSIRRAYRRDLDTGVTETASLNEFDINSSAGDGVSLNSDGRYFAFEGRVGTNGRQGILVHDFQDSTTTIVTVPADTQATINSTASDPVISHDGEVVAFESSATNLDPEISGNFNLQIYSIDWLSDSPTAQMLSRSADGTVAGNSPSSNAFISGNGSTVTFTSSANNLSELDTNFSLDIFAVRGVGLVVTAPRVSEGDDGTTELSFEINLLNPPIEDGTPVDVTVDFATADGTATLANNDYVSASGSLTFNVDNPTRTVVVTVNGDIRGEEDETVELILSNVVGSQILTPSTLGTILNDDSTISIDNATIVEGDDGQPFLEFNVSQVPISNREISVDFSTADGTATTADNDYVATSGTLVLPAGQGSGVIQVPINGDEIPEAFETFTVTLTNAVDTVIGVGTAIGTIANDDANITVDADSFLEGDTSVRRPDATVRLSHRVASNVTFDYTTVDGTAVSDADYQSSSGSRNDLHRADDDSNPTGDQWRSYRRRQRDIRTFVVKYRWDQQRHGESRFHHRR